MLNSKRICIFLIQNSQRIQQRKESALYVVIYTNRKKEKRKKVKIFFYTGDEICINGMFELWM